MSLYFAQVLRESCLCFRYGRRICKRRCGSGTDTAWREGKKSHSYAYDSGTATACTRTSTFQDELAGGRTRFAWRGNCTLCLYTTPAAESCQWLWKYARKSNWTAKKFFSTAQMTQIAQIVSLSLNQAMGEFNMRLNGLQQQVVHQQNVFAQGTGAASCITTSSGTSCEDITFYLKWFVIIWRSSTHQSTTQLSKEHCGTATRFAAVASETD